MNQYEGKTVTVLCEGSSKKMIRFQQVIPKRISQLTLKVHEAIGKLVNVEIDETKQYSLNGTFKEFNDAPLVTN